MQTLNDKDNFIYHIKDHQYKSTCINLLIFYLFQNNCIATNRLPWVGRQGDERQPPRLHLLRDQPPREHLRQHGRSIRELKKYSLKLKKNVILQGFLK